MGVRNQIGTIQPGMIADMDIIHGNPLQSGSDPLAASANVDQATLGAPEY